MGGRAAASARRKVPAQRTAAPAVPADNHVIGDTDLHLFHEGTHARLHEKLGSHPRVKDGAAGGFSFAVWAPNATAVSVIGDFNDWDPARAPLARVAKSGVWHADVPDAPLGARYKYRIVSALDGRVLEKADPFAFKHESAPATSSLLCNLDYRWADDAWMHKRATCNTRSSPISIYEVHLGSWMRVPEEGDRVLTYAEIAPRLADHVHRLGFTHVELMPLTEHPFYGSWGYETTGYFATTSRYGTPQELMGLVDHFHQRGIGVILDWVPGHFPSDAHGLASFDGTHLFEHADPRQGFHPEWKTCIFNYARHEVRSFLLSSAVFWLDKFHVDGLRVDGVASMLYLDYGRQHGEWIPNEHGGRENLAAAGFLRQLNDAVAREYPGVATIAEESTSWPGVTGATDKGGLGFSFKWDLGWMHDSLDYLGHAPIHRRHHHKLLTFRGMYQFNENYVLPLSHDEVVHGKRSLIGKMDGDDWQRRANLRLLYALQFTQPGKKLIFMGSEIAQEQEWNHDRSLDWHLLQHEPARQLQLLIGELNRLYRAERSLHDLDCDPAGFRWMDANDAERSILAYERIATDPVDRLVIVLNFTPAVVRNYRLGVPTGGSWSEVLNTDAREFGGSGQGNLGSVEAVPIRCHGREWSLNLTLPPLGAICVRREPPKK